MRKLIITADDYGMCPSVNEGIDACLQAGAVRATCVMVNMSYCAAAGDLRRRFPHCSVGIHWTLTQGRPVLPASRVPSLVTGTGEFHTSAEFRRRWLLGRIQRAEIHAELEAQHHRLTEIAGSPDFWNTHQNVHILPGLFQHCVAIGRELGIPAMRCHTRVTVPRLTSSSRYAIRHPLSWMKGEVIARWSRTAKKKVRMPDGRIYMPGYNGTSVAFLEDILERVPWGRVERALEVVVHPASRVEGLSGSLIGSRVREYEVLRDSTLANRLTHRGIQIAGFEAVQALD
jgi:predicted glycoside hydrolase/deacetylase ChbG (UPF0249 family)